MENIIRSGNYNATCALYDVDKADGRLMINYSKKYTHMRTHIKIFIYKYKIWNYWKHENYSRSLLYLTII